MSARTRPGPGGPAGRVAEARRLLSARPMATDELLAALRVSQPSLSRTIQRVPGAFMFRVRGTRTPRYGLVRMLPGGVPGEQQVYRVDPTGAVSRVGTVALLAGGATYFGGAQGGQLFEGLPPSMAFAALAGFLGRQVAHAVASGLALPGSLRDWSDDHHAAYLFACGSDLPGDLVFGDAALALALQARAQLEPTPAHDKLGAYAARTAAMADTAWGSSVGGEQPKFLAHTQDRGHVIVKFARAGSRMAELLHLERLALGCLRDAGVAAAEAQVLEGDGFVFLELVRFDRQGPLGRLGMVSAGAIDDEHFGRRDSWSAFARSCAAARLVTAQDELRIHIMAAFSELIGNNDRHFDNLSLMLDGRGGIAGVAPAYDILPMQYAPIGGGLEPALRPVEPRLGAIGGLPAVWLPAARAALAFWRRVVNDPELGVSAPMRAVAARNLDVVQAFVAPWVEVSVLAR